MVIGSFICQAVMREDAKSVWETRGVLCKCILIKEGRVKASLFELEVMSI